MPRIRRIDPPWSYVIAALLAAVTVAFRVTLIPWHHPFLILFLLPVAATAYVAGFRPALLSTAAVALAAAYWVLPSAHAPWAWRGDEAVQLGWFCFTAVVVAWLTDSAYRAGRRAEEAERHADRVEQEARAAQALQRTEDRFRAMFDDAAVGIVELDAEDRIVAANARYCAMLGYSQPELVGRTVYDVTAPEDAERTRELNRKGRAGELRTSQYEKRYVRRDGSSVWVDINVAFVRDAAGNFLRVVGTATDITERKRAEHALRDAEERFRAFMDNSPARAWAKDENGRYVYVNATYERVIGYRLADVRGKTDFDLWPPEAARTFAENDLAVLRADRPIVVSETTRDREGRERHWANSKFPFRDATGRRYVGGIGIDVTDRAEAAAALQRANRELRDADRMKNEFLGMLSHELRNPLTPIRTSVYVLRRSPPASDQAARARAVIERQTEHLTRIVDDLLDVTRIVRGKVLLHRSRLDLRELVLRAVEDARLNIEARGLRIAVSVPTSRLWADADATRLNQVLGNLLNNATKFTNAGGEILVTLREVDATAELTVRDTGVGIDPHVLPNVFDAFVQGERTLARSAGGLGLGLALVRGLVELHGGSVRAVSEGVGTGAEFVITLPLVGPIIGDLPTSGTPPAHPPTPRHVLVVDDNADAAESFAELVRLLGHEVDVAYDGPSAIEKVRRNRPELVLCDIGLPGMTGYDVARALRLDPGSGIRLVAVSGYAQPEDVERALEAGFDEHIAKPPDPASIERLLA